MAAPNNSSTSGWFTAAAVCAALAATLVVLPFVGVFWGVRELIRWKRNADLPIRVGRPLAGTAALLAGALVITAGVAAAVTDGPKQSASFAASGVTPTAPAALPTYPTPVQEPSTTTTTTTQPAVVPAVVGDPFDQAQSVLYARSIRFWHEDLSPRDRSVFQEKNWTVVATDPAVGQPLAAGTSVTLYLLKNEEAAWFAEHPRMPKLTIGQDTTKVVQRHLKPVRELLEFRYAKGAAPNHSSPAHERTPKAGRGLADEPAAERAARAGLADAGEYGVVAGVGSIPRASKVLRPGQLLVVLVKDVPVSPGGGGDVPYVPIPDGDDDDDVNVPGWLCPTRFC